MQTTDNYTASHLDHIDDNASRTTDWYFGCNQYKKETSQLYNPCTLQMCEELSHHHIMKSTDSDR